MDLMEIGIIWLIVILVIVAAALKEDTLVKVKVCEQYQEAWRIAKYAVSQIEIGTNTDKTFVAYLEVAISHMSLSSSYTSIDFTTTVDKTLIVKKQSH